MLISVGMLIAAAVAGQEPQAEPPPAPRYGRLSASATAAAAWRAGEQPAADAPPSDDSAESWGMDLYADRPRLTVSQRMDRDCADGVRAADESQAACRERIAEAAIQESLSRGNVTRRTPEWTEQNEREWVQAPRRNPIDRLRDCRQSSERSRDGESSSWSIRCGDQDGPAAEALNRLLQRD